MTDHATSPLTMTAEEICHELQISRRTLTNMRNRKDIPEPVIERHNFVRWNRKQVLDCIMPKSEAK